MGVGLDTPLADVLGGKGAARLRLGLELATGADLLGHYPRRYQPQDGHTTVKRNRSVLPWQVGQRP